MIFERAVRKHRTNVITTVDSFITDIIENIEHI